MEREREKTPVWLVAALSIGLIMAAGCSLLISDGANTPENEVPDFLDDGDIRKGLAAEGSTFVPVWGYKYGDKGLEPSAEKFLKDEYAEWKATYVVSAPELSGTAKRVRRDQGNGKTPYDTVSEGQAYGMLLAVYFDDKALFDGLLEYSMAHAAFDTYLMHWYVRADGKNISEFWGTVPHGNPYYKLSQTNYGIVVTDYKAPRYYFLPEPPANTNMPWYFVAKEGEYKRELSNATDADLDMAASLIFANKRWGSSYKTHAVKIIKAIIKNDLEEYEENGTKKYMVKAGKSWGGRDGWNPSYYTPAYWMLFGKYIDASPGDFTGGNNPNYKGKCESVISTMNEHMSLISRGNNAGLFPDWVVTDVNAGTQSRATNSDRIYFQFKNNGWVDEVVDYDNDGHITKRDAIKMQSYNFYYDAVRTPWRLALGYSWYGDTTADAMSDKMAAFFKGKLNSFVDGYANNGDPWKWDQRDGFNYGQPRARTAGDVPSITFLSMLQASFLNYNRSEAKTWYSKLKANQETDANYHYYGNTLRMMSLLYMSGYMVNLWDCKTYDESKAPVAGKTYRIRNRASAKSYLTIDGVTADNKVHWSSLDGDKTSTKYLKALWRIAKVTLNGTEYSVLMNAFGTGNPTYYYLKFETDDYVKRVQQTSAPDNSYGWTISNGSSAGFYRLIGYRGMAYLEDAPSLHVKVGSVPANMTQYADWEFELAE